MRWRCKKFFGLIGRGVRRAGDDVFRHDFAHQTARVFFKAQVTTGDDADQSALVDDGKAREFFAFHDRENVSHRLIRADGDGIFDDAGFAFLNLTNLVGMLLDVKFL